MDGRWTLRNLSSISPPCGFLPPVSVEDFYRPEGAHIFADAPCFFSGDNLSNIENISENPLLSHFPRITASFSQSSWLRRLHPAVFTGVFQLSAPSWKKSEIQQKGSHRSGQSRQLRPGKRPPARRQQPEPARHIMSLFISPGTAIKLPISPSICSSADSGLEEGSETRAFARWI